MGGGSVLLAILTLQKQKKIIIKNKVYAYDLNLALINTFKQSNESNLIRKGISLNKQSRRGSKLHWYISKMRRLKRSDRKLVSRLYLLYNVNTIKYCLNTV